jgi:hypothetical protein
MVGEKRPQDFDLEFFSSPISRIRKDKTFYAVRVCMCMHVCMYVFMYECMYVYMYVLVCMYICMYSYVCMCVCMYVCIHVCMYFCMCVCMYSCMYVLVCMYVCMHACMYSYVCMYVCVHACMYSYVCMYVYVCVCMYACMQACMCVCTYVMCASLAPERLEGFCSYSALKEFIRYRSVKMNILDPKLGSLQLSPKKQDDNCLKNGPNDFRWISVIYAPPPTHI